MIHRGNKPFNEEEVVERILTNVYKAEDGCLIWAGSKSPEGRPRIYWKGVYYSAQRLLLKLTRGRSHYRPKWVVQMKCNNPACVNPEHLTMTPKGVVLRRAIEDGKRQSGFGLAIALGRAKKARLGIDKARTVWAMRADGKTYKQIGEEYGVTQSCVYAAIKTWQRLGVL